MDKTTEEMLEALNEYRASCVQAQKHQSTNQALADLENIISNIEAIRQGLIAYQTAHIALRLKKVQILEKALEFSE